MTARKFFPVGVELIGGSALTRRATEVKEGAASRTGQRFSNKKPGAGQPGSCCDG